MRNSLKYGHLVATLKKAGIHSASRGLLAVGAIGTALWACATAGKSAHEDVQSMESAVATGGPESNCQDGIDNNGNGAIDCAELTDCPNGTACGFSSACWDGFCGLSSDHDAGPAGCTTAKGGTCGFVIAPAPITVTGNTVSMTVMDPGPTTFWVAPQDSDCNCLCSGAGPEGPGDIALGRRYCPGDVVTANVPNGYCLCTEAVAGQLSCCPGVAEGQPGGCSATTEECNPNTRTCCATAAPGASCNAAFPCCPGLTCGTDGKCKVASGG